MKRVFMAGIGAVAILSTVPFLTQLPGWQSSSAVAESKQNQPALQLRLEAEKKVVTKDQQGKDKVSWQALTGKGLVVPGDVLRYTLNGQNTSDRQLKNIKLNQPIPQGMMYVLKSANPAKDSKVTYSIDGGRSFVENPKVKNTLPNGQVVIQPAPATAYTHLRFEVPVLAGKQQIKVSYETQVR